MFDLRLSAEQLEFRDTIRDFVRNEVLPVALASSRLEPFEKPLLVDVLDKAARVGLRTLALSEGAGGAGADALTTAIVMEELGAGEVDVATAIALTSESGRLLFDGLMTPEQRKRFLPDFLENDRYHLALARHDRASTLGWHYHRQTADEAEGVPTAVRQSSGDLIVNGACAFVADAPIAQLFAIDVRTDAGATETVLVARDTAGLVVHEPVHAFVGTGKGAKNATRWHHGTGAAISLKDCRVPKTDVIGKDTARARETQHARSTLQTTAINLGLGRLAYETAIEYAKMRVQGGRRIIEHQAIGTIIAECTIKLELARNMLWKAAWALDHPDAVAERSISDLPLATMARVYTAQAVHEVALGAAECFGAMGVMRDMPLQKHVHDSLIFLHAADHDSATLLGIAEAVAGFERLQACA